MTRTVSWSILAAACLAGALAALWHTNASAGAVTTGGTVYIPTMTGAGFAQGPLGAVRNSSDGVEDIGCATLFVAFNNQPLIGCSATNSAGVSRTCWFSGRDGQSGVYGLTDDTFLYFAWDASGACTEVETLNSSKYEPKRP